MHKKKIREKPAQRVWDDFIEQWRPSEQQLEQFKAYAGLLLEWNKERNLTAITNLAGVVNQHFSDSLMLAELYDLSSVKVICDVGSGAGFPGVPLKIMYPELNLLLMEVKYRKREFLGHAIERLGLEGVEVVSLDWRTFLRTTEGEVDLFVTKAALHEEELIRLFRSNCAYKEKNLIYWASGDWEPAEKAAPFMRKEFPYKLKSKERKLVLFSK